MARYTVNLARARSFSRRKRASKAMKILREELEEREGEEVSISPEVNSRIWENGIERPPARLEVEVKDTVEGLRAVLPGEEVEEPESEPEDETEEQEEEKVDEETEVDYEGIVSGTVSDAKEQLQELDDPDYEAALEAEENGKDRKTLKEWIKSRV